MKDNERKKALTGRIEMEENKMEGTAERGLMREVGERESRVERDIIL